MQARIYYASRSRQKECPDFTTRVFSALAHFSSLTINDTSLAKKLFAHLYNRLRRTLHVLAKSACSLEQAHRVATRWQPWRSTLGRGYQRRALHDLSGNTWWSVERLEGV